MIRTKESLKRGTLLNIAFDIFKEDRPIKRLCRVTRCAESKKSGFYDIGVMFLAMSASEIQKLEKYLESP